MTITGSTISDNEALGSPGGAIRSQSTGTPTSVTLTSSVMQRNSSLVNGGAIDIGTSGGNSTVTVTDSVISDSSGNFGGAIFASSAAKATVTITDSSLYNNGGSKGGAVFAGSTDAPEVSITNSTLAGNSAQSGGAVSAASGAVELRHSTLAASTTTAGSHVEAADLTSTASVLAEPVGPGDNCELTNSTTSNGYNYDDDGTFGFGAGTGDVSDGDAPLLGQARHNGDLPAAAEAGGNGTVRPTMFPLAGSPLIDAIPPGSCSVAPELDLDERGVDRPFGAGCDIGAIESVIPSHDRNDVSAFYEPTVRWVTSAVNTPQILLGYPDGTFGQSRNITRGQAARLYHNGAGPRRQRPPRPRLHRLDPVLRRRHPLGQSAGPVQRVPRQHLPPQRPHQPRQLHPLAVQLRRHTGRVRTPRSRAHRRDPLLRRRRAMGKRQRPGQRLPRSHLQTEQQHQPRQRRPHLLQHRPNPHRLERHHGRPPNMLFKDNLTP